MVETESAVDLRLSDDQAFFQATTRRFLAERTPLSRVRDLIDDPRGFDLDAWRQGAELGWFSMLVPEADGGGSVSGSGVVDLMIIARELGSALFPGPVLTTNVVAAALARGGSAEQVAAWLPDIVSGETIASWAVAELDGRWDVRGADMMARPSVDGLVLSGVKTAVEFGDAADLFLVSARSDGGVLHALVPADSQGVSAVALGHMDLARRFAEVQFDDVVVPSSCILGTPLNGESLLRSLLDLAIILQCAETLGAMERTFAFTLEYSKDRKAFGRPIGSFQAIKHRFADMALWLESSEAAAEAAADAVQADIPGTDAPSIAKAYIADRAVDLVRECLQIHGGIGFTWEHDLHLFLRRVESNRAIFGDPEVQLDRLAEKVGL